jgi:Trypsin-like peptidase domain
MIKQGTNMGLLIILASIGVIYTCDLVWANPKAHSISPRSPFFPNPIEALARKITVKIGGTESIGSGILIAKEGSTYTVLTNQHVLRSGQIQVQTPDGEWVNAVEVKLPQGQQQDSALLQFNSQRNYTIANLNPNPSLKPGSPIYAAGFPFDSSEADSSGWKFTTGQMILQSEIPLEDGYQIAYSNATLQGMSGGAILDQRGEVVALHGQGPALLDIVYKDEKGKAFCDGMQKIMSRYSWGIPIGRVLKRVMPTQNTPSQPIHSASNQDPLKSTLDLEIYSDLDLSNLSTDFDRLMLNEEIRSAKNCTTPFKEPSPKPIEPWIIFERSSNQVLKKIQIQ